MQRTGADVNSLAAKILLRLLLLALLGAGVWLWFALSPVRHAPGILIPNAPVQTETEPFVLAERLPGPAGEYTLTQLAGLHIWGRVLSVQRYRDDRAALAPMDILLGWGEMSDSRVISELALSQAGRDYTLRWKASPLLDPGAAARQCANLHVIPANAEIGRLLGQLKPGCLVDFRGSLVEARKKETQKEEFLWRSSLQRDDTGPGSGELILLTQARFFAGNQKRAVESARVLQAETQDDLKRWFDSLQQRRQNLDVNDPAAVREFNLEAQRYMTAAHPKPSPPAPQETTKAAKEKKVP